MNETNNNVKGGFVAKDWGSMAEVVEKWQMIELHTGGGCMAYNMYINGHLIWISDDSGLPTDDSFTMDTVIEWDGEFNDQSVSVQVLEGPEGLDKYLELVVPTIKSKTGA